MEKEKNLDSVHNNESKMSKKRLYDHGNWLIKEIKSDQTVSWD